MSPEDDPVPCTVLDPFVGSGTTCAVSIALGRRSIGIDLSAKYLVNNAVPRIRGVLSRSAEGALLDPTETVKVVVGVSMKLNGL